MNFRRYLANLAIVIGFFIGVTFVSLWLYIRMNALGICFMPAIVVVPIIGAAGVAIGALAYYSLSEKIKAESHEKLLLRFIEDETERKIVEHLLAKKVEKQANIARMVGDKVKASRILTRLERRGLIRRESVGKIKLVRLVEP